jgi:hypothetical protein
VKLLGLLFRELFVVRVQRFDHAHSHVGIETLRSSPLPVDFGLEIACHTSHTVLQGFQSCESLLNLVPVETTSLPGCHD